jgi:HEAT repeat protein
MTHHRDFWLHVERLGRPRHEEPFDQDSAWRQLTPTSKLFSACKAAVIAPEADFLENAWEALQEPAIHRFLEANLYRNPGDARHSVDVARLLRNLRGFVAAVRAARAVLWPDPDRRRRDSALLYWSHETAQLWGGTSSTEGLLEPLSEFVRLVADRFDTGKRSWPDRILPAHLLDDHLKELARRRPDQWRVGAARDCVRALLDDPRPVERQGSMSVLTCADTGRVLRLVVELLPDGTGDCYPDPRLFGLHPITPSFLEAAHTAWAEAQREAGPEHARSYDVRWRVTANAPLHTLDGASMGAALAVALTQLLRNQPIGRDCAITAEICSGGRLSPVEHVHAKAREALSKGQLRYLVVHRDNADAVRRAASDLGHAHSDEAVREVADLKEAIRATSGLVTDLATYYEGLIRVPEKDKEEPAPLYGGRSLAHLYVRPDFVRLERRAEREQRPEGLPADDEEDRPPVNLALAREILDLGEDALFAGNERGRLVTWDQAWSEWSQERARIVIKGAPGQGKSVLTQMLARTVAQKGKEQLSRREDPPRLEELPRPIVVRLSLLLSQGLPDGIAAGTTLRARLEACLRDQQGCTAEASRFLAAHAHEPQTWLILDALDEVGADRATLDTFSRLLNQPDWRCRVLITTRPYGYDERSVRLDRVVLFRLGALSSSQQKELIGKWFNGGQREGGTGSVGVERLRERSAAVRLMSQNALLLSLLCGIAEDGDVGDDVSRTQLYDRALARILGGPTRAAEWEACLRELARRLFLRDEHNLVIPEVDLLDFLRETRTRPPLEGPSRKDQEIAIALLHELLRKRLLVRVGARGFVMFGHRTFAEFLMARAMAWRIREDGWRVAQLRWIEGEDRLVSDLVDHKAWLPGWHEAIVFLGGMLDRPRPLVELLVDEQKDDDFCHRLALAARALAETGAAARTLLADLIDSVTTRLFSAWWSHSQKNTHAAIPHLRVALPALATLNGRLSGFSFSQHVGQRARRQGSVTDPLLDYLDEHHETRKGSAPQHRHVPFLDSLRRLPALLMMDRNAVVGTLKALGAAAATGPLLDHLAKRLANYDLTRGGSPLELYAVAALGPPAATDSILSQLPRLLARGDYQAVETLGELGPAAATDSFLSQIAGLFHNRDTKTRITAAYAVRALGPPAATDRILDGLAQLLDDSEQAVRLAAAGAVGALGAAAVTDPILSRLGQLFGSGGEAVQSVAGRAVRALGVETAISPILDYLAQRLDGESPVVRSAAARAVEGWGPVAATEVILERLHRLFDDGSEDVRCAAAEAVRALGAAAATEPILDHLPRLLEDEHDRVRSSAARAVVSLEAAAATHPILDALPRLLDDEASYVRSAAVRAITALGAMTTNSFIERLPGLLCDQMASVRHAAARSVGALLEVSSAPAPVLEGLIQLLGDAAETVRSAAAEALGALGARITGPILNRLNQAFADKDRFVRSGAAKAIEALQSKRSSELRFWGMIRRRTPGTEIVVQHLSDLGA